MNLSKGKNWLPICCVLVAAFFIQGWVGAGSVSAADDSLACTDCHYEQQDAEFPHNPAREGFCEACHEPSPEHLEMGGPGGMKTDGSATACNQCHEAKDEGENLHPALMMDDCVQCHNPHGSDNEMLLVQPKNRLCFDCHDPIPAGTAEGSDHSVVTDENSCLNCHDPHSSDQGALLVSDQKSLCLGCHDGAIGEVQDIGQKLGMASVHEPVNWDDACTSCHAPHGSEYRSLLLAGFPEESYVEAGEGTFELCFNCHDQGLLEEAGDTGFRDDTARDGAVVSQNLHWYHVTAAAGSGDGSRGRSCSICHDPHGATQPHLINAWWTMKSYQPILDFEDRPDGGECLRSCHAPKRYQRIE